MWVSEKFGLISKINSEAFLMGLEVSFLDNFFCQRVLGSQICCFSLLLIFKSHILQSSWVQLKNIELSASRLNQAVKQDKAVYWWASTRNFQLLESWRGGEGEGAQIFKK